MNKYTLEGVYADTRVSHVLAESATIKTVQGFLRKYPDLGWKAIEHGLVMLFIRWWKNGVEVDENLDQMELDWVKGPAKFVKQT